MPGKPVYRQRKLKSHGEMIAAVGHNARFHTVQHAESERAGQNIIEGQPAIVDAWKERVGNQHVRKNGVLAVELLCGFSPSERDRIDCKKWYEDCKKWAGEQFGGEANVIHGSLHADEKTPHCHFIVVPIRPDNGRLSASYYSDGRQHLQKRQKDYALKIGKKHGLDEPDYGSQAEHIDPKEWRREIEAAVHGAPKIEPKKAFQNAQKHVEEANRKLRESDLKRRATEMEAEQARKRAEKAEAKLKSSTAKLRDMDLLRVMEACGYEVSRVNGSEHIFKTDQGHVSVNVQRQKYSCDWSKGGGGAIDLAMTARNLNFADAVAWLRELDPTAAVASAANYGARTAKSVGTASPEEKFRVQTEPDPEKYPQVRDYLVERRRIPEAIVQEEYESNNLWANRYGSVVLPHWQGDELIGAEIRGTTTDYKAFAGRKASYCLPASAHDVEPAVVESGIDALSLRALGYQGEIHSVAGSSVPDSLLSIDGLRIALDNDEAGDRGAEKALAASPSAKRLPPKGAKDWNAELVLRRMAAAGVKVITKAARAVQKQWNQYVGSKITNREIQVEASATESVSGVRY